MPRGHFLPAAEMTPSQPLLMRELGWGPGQCKPFLPHFPRSLSETRTFSAPQQLPGTSELCRAESRGPGGRGRWGPARSSEPLGPAPGHALSLAVSQHRAFLSSAPCPRLNGFQAWRGKEGKRFIVTLKPQHCPREWGGEEPGDLWGRHLTTGDGRGKNGGPA